MTKNGAFPPAGTLPIAKLRVSVRGSVIVALT
jgi:hypothetical protein